MTVVTVRDESANQGNFYVPHFEVKIAGVGLPDDVLRDVQQLSYRDDIKGIDGFELTVNNWDAARDDFKYVGAETTASLRQDPLHTLFDPCNREVEIRMGYLGGLVTVLRGNITTLEPDFPRSGAPTLAVRGLNVLHQLRRKQYTTGWTNERISDIAENIAILRDGGKKRFPLPIVTNESAKSDESELPFVSQKNRYDIDFLMELARRQGYVVFVKEADSTRNLPRRLYFGPSEAEGPPGLRDVTFKLEWGRSILDFKPTLTTANQVKSVTVNGWNRRARRPISVTVGLDDRRLNLNRDMRAVLEACDPREEWVEDEPVFTRAQARERARAILRDRFKEMVKVRVATVGLPDLRAGQQVEIAGVGARFSGTYFVTDSAHAIGDGGYTTVFNARREDRGPGGGA